MDYSDYICSFFFRIISLRIYLKVTTHDYIVNIQL